MGERFHSMKSWGTDEWFHTVELRGWASDSTVSNSSSIMWNCESWVSGSMAWNCGGWTSDSTVWNSGVGERFHSGESWGSRPVIPLCGIMGSR